MRTNTVNLTSIYCHNKSDFIMAASYPQADIDARYCASYVFSEVAFYRFTLALMLHT